MADGLRGIREGWKRDQAIRTLAVVVLVVAGLAAELMNSALEAALDKVHPDLDPAIGAAKEMASAAAAVINLSAIALFLGAIQTAII